MLTKSSKVSKHQNSNKKDAQNNPQKPIKSKSENQTEKNSACEVKKPLKKACHVKKCLKIFKTSFNQAGSWMLASLSFQSF